MLPSEEAAFEANAEKMLAGHRQAPNGRNVFAFVMRYLNNDGYRDKFDNTFNQPPSSRAWFDSKFCSECGENKAWCKCNKSN